MEKILIVDDDSFLLDMYAVKFGESEFNVDTSKSVEEALSKLRGGKTYDIVLLDMIMPHLNGMDLLRAIKSESLGADPVCIVLSNQGEKEDVEEAKALGADGYIIKANVIPSEVVAQVKSVFAHKKKKE